MQHPCHSSLQRRSGVTTLLPDSFEPPKVPQRFGPRHELEQRVFLGAIPNPSHGARIAHVVALYQGGTRGFADVTGQNRQRGGLPGAVDAQKAEGFPLGHRERDACRTDKSLMCAETRPSRPSWDSLRVGISNFATVGITITSALLLWIRITFYGMFGRRSSRSKQGWGIDLVQIVQKNRRFVPSTSCGRSLCCGLCGCYFRCS